ncbi:hypothetical protein GGR51DRAFT_540003 [Nemania sp. FL0031]|nr:hypothetical protein GGR51DRAFT_540003 [Nemania sp. FL0031]
MQERPVELGRIMDQCTQEMDSWQQVYRGDESIYCAAPLPSSPNDIICLGSDDETDGATRNAKRQRYEEHGRRYLQGRPLYIFSASLRGPFSRASGWQNPWLPKPPSHHAQCLDSLSRPPLASSAIRPESNIPVNTPSSEESSTTQGPYDSMDCHLPSPESHEDLQFFGSPSPGERRTRIESWADNVHRDILEKDDFWAPNHNGSTVKRPAGRDWLKRRPAKRRKPDAFQNITESYTPTPILPPHSKAKRNEPSTQRSINRSFEMTTPSSSPEQGPRESLTLANHQQVSCEERRPIPSNVSTEGSLTSIEPSMPSRKGEGEPEVEDKSEEVQNGQQSEDICQDQIPRETPHRSEDTENATGFHDCADESFFYRTRQLKQSTPTAASSAIVVDCPSQHTQTKEPLARIYDDSAIVSSNQNAQISGPKATCDHLNSNESPLAVATNNATAIEPDHVLLQYQKAIAPRCSTTDTNADTNSRSRVDSSRPLNDITSDPRLNICDATSQTIVEVKEAQCTNPESPLDDGPTLVGDPMDTEERVDVKAAPQNSRIISEQSLLLQHYAISATIMTNASQTSQFCEVATPDKLNGVESYPTDTTPQGVLIESQSTITKPIDQIVRRELARSIISSNTITGQGYEGKPQTMADDQTIPASQQSPWVPVYIANSSIQYDNHNSNDMERAEQSLEGESAKARTALSKSSVLTHCSPTIRPSQQSPWAQGALEASRVRLVEASSINPVVTIDVGLTGNFQRQTPVANEESRCSSPAISHISGCQHQSPESGIGAKEGALPSIQELPYTPIPRVPRKSTPNGDVSIRSFSNFNFLSPQRSVRPPGSSASRSILSIRNNSSRQTTTRSSKRVSFATLPQEQENNSSPPSTRTRAASPPLPTLVDVEEENVDGRYRKHFDVMNCRFTANETPNLQYYRRLLPSCSQQKPESPSVDAMAEAFREADTHQSNHEDNVFEDTRAEEEEAEEAVIEIEDRPQSPWQQDGEGTDDVAAVIGNLSEFLDVWDVDTEMDRNRVELNEVGSHGVPSNTEVGILHGVGIW